MGQRQPDGTMIPAHLASTSMGEAEDIGMLSDMTLRLGEVVEIIYPDNAKSKTGRFIEYTVDCFSRESGSIGTKVRYEGVLLSNLFGNGADIFKFTLRLSNKKENEDGTVGLGAKVLILCQNGESASSFIIGGVRDTSTETTSDSKDDGHHLLWKFNGIGVNINKDGELALTFGGATDVDGKLSEGVDKNNAGAGITLKKDGSLEIQDAATLQKIQIVHPDGKIHIEASKLLETVASDGTTIDSANGLVKITSKGTKIGGDAAVDALVMGTTYRSKEIDLHTTMLASLTKMATLLGTVATLNSTIGITLVGIGVSFAAPIVGPVVAAPQVGIAAVTFFAMSTAVSSLAAEVANIIQAIAKFEAGASSYLSKKNTTD